MITFVQRSLLCDSLNISHGTGRKETILTALGRKSYWHLPKTLATQTGMTNKWLAGLGLISVHDLWIKAHGYS